jgi:hypothetical protein
MAHTASGKRTLRARIKRVRKAVSGRVAHEQVSSSTPWVTALARVKKHIQAESRHITHTS